MARNSGKILGLPVPDIPVDINAPRSSRKRPAENASQATSNSLSAPPSKLIKTDSQPTDMHPPTSTEPAGPTTTTTAAPQNKKKKKTAAPTSDVVGDVEMAAPAPSAAAETGSIIISGSLVPPALLKKKSKKKSKGKKMVPESTLVTGPAPPTEYPSQPVSTTPSAPDVAGDGAPVDTTPGSTSDVGVESLAGGGKSGGRVKALSSVAQKGTFKYLSHKRRGCANSDFSHSPPTGKPKLVQINCPDTYTNETLLIELLEKQAKAQRKKDKVLKAIIEEPMATTAAFVASSDASGSVQSTTNNIKVSLA
jgi:hypothetical protein